MVNGTCSSTGFRGCGVTAIPEETVKAIKAEADEVKVKVPKSKNDGK